MVACRWESLANDPDSVNLRGDRFGHEDKEPRRFLFDHMTEETGGLAAGNPVEDGATAYFNVSKAIALPEGSAPVVVWKSGAQRRGVGENERSTERQGGEPLIEGSIDLGQDRWRVNDILRSVLVALQ